MKAKVDKIVKNAMLASPAMSEKQARNIAETEYKFEIEGFDSVSVKNLVDLESRRKAEEEKSLKEVGKTTVATTEESIVTEISNKAKAVGTKVKKSAIVLGTETAEAIKEVGKTVEIAGSGLKQVVEGVKAKIKTRKAKDNVVDDSGYWNAGVEVGDIPKYEDDGKNGNLLQNIVDEYQK